MPDTQYIEVKHIFQNLKNLRTVPQQDETAAIKALIAINPDWFYSLMESIIESGYLPVENVVVIQNGKNDFVVQEGNRRIAILKILLGLHDIKDFDLPKTLVTDAAALTKAWKTANKTVPCLIYQPAEIATANRIVSLVHGKGERAGRLKWTSVARAREARDINGKAQPGLDLLEKYLSKGSNINQTQREKWSGDYPLSVLDEAISKLLPRINFKSAADLVTGYPKLPHRKELENLMHDIGTSTIGFSSIRGDTEAFFVGYGFPALTPAPTKGKGGNPTGGATGGAGKGGGKGKKNPQAYATNDPKSVRALLKGFSPNGKDRQKVAALRDEAVKLKIEGTPLAFCFVLRSMFEISAKAYCGDHNIPIIYTKTKGGVSQTWEKPLSDLLTEVTKHLIAAQGGDKQFIKTLHGAQTELTKPDGVLSITSMNQLVHNPQFSIAPGDIARVFSNIFPLLQYMN